MKDKRIIGWVVNDIQFRNRKCGLGGYARIEIKLHGIKWNAKKKLWMRPIYDTIIPVKVK